MTRVLAAGLVALLVSIIAGPKFIAFLRRKRFGQHIREDGPEHHIVKQGTPTVGGVLIVVPATLAFLALSHYRLEALIVLFVTLSCAAIGFADDFIKLTHRRSLGLPGRWKLVLLALVTAGVALAVGELDVPHRTDVFIPFVNWSVPLSWAWYGFLFLVVAGTANGVNLTDGIDGLAAGTGMIALFTVTAMNVMAFIRSSRQPELRSVDKLDLAILGAALIGGVIGFLWYNAFPAEVIMGDTGAMAIGGALAGFAIVTKTEFLLLLIGGIFVVEALSVMIQVFTFKYLDRRVFLMAPIHHHFELKPWSETQIMVRFWTLRGLLCRSAFALYYRYYFATT